MSLPRICFFVLLFFEKKTITWEGCGEFRSNFYILRWRVKLITVDPIFDYYILYVSFNYHFSKNKESNPSTSEQSRKMLLQIIDTCLLYTSDAADE